MTSSTTEFIGCLHLGQVGTDVSLSLVTSSLSKRMNQIERVQILVEAEEVGT
jgi:hypothetical protein